MSGLQAARMGDSIGGHTSAFWGFIVGLAIGLAVGLAFALLVLTAPISGPLLAIGAACVAVGGLVSLGAVGAKLGKHWGSTMKGDGTPCSIIPIGSLDTKIEDQPAARAEMDLSGPCLIKKMPPLPLSQGSSLVFVNAKMLVRNTDKAKCGGTVIMHCLNVWIGGPAGGEDSSELPDWVPSDHTLDMLALGGGLVALAGSVIVFGAVATVIMGGIGLAGGKLSKLGGDWLGARRDRAEGRTDHQWENLYGESAEVGGGLLAGMAGGKVAGMANARLSEVPMFNKGGITRGFDPPPLKAMTANMDPVAQNKMLGELAKNPALSKQMMELQGKGYTVNPDGSLQSPHTNPTTREITTPPKATGEQIVTPPRQEEIVPPPREETPAVDTPDAPTAAVRENKPYVANQDGYYRDRLFMDHMTHDPPPEGWKMHVSADPNDSHAVADAVLPTLREMGVNHKVMADPGAYAQMTGGQEGKFITIYPDNPAQAAEIARILGPKIAALKPGPKIEGEMMIGDGIYTRYGGFTKGTVTDPATGLQVPDVRGQIAPKWVENPFTPKGPEGLPAAEGGCTTCGAAAEVPKASAVEPAPTAPTAKTATPEQAKALDVLYERAGGAKTEIDAAADQIANKLGGKVAKAPLKGRARALEKANNDYDGDVTRLKDVARNTVVVKAGKEGEALAMLRELNPNISDKNVKVIDAAQDPLGYSGTNVSVPTSHGPAEVQINSPEMIYAKESPANARNILGNETYDALANTHGMPPGGEGHAYYEQYRSSSDPALKAKVAEESRAYYDQVRRAAAGGGDP